ncbi:alpha/beta hydrolase, partial [Acidiferrimicrobium sp. IK]|nr:alpha/beta hydrolase [Acidiferrimicrobium sp. IK]
MRISTRAGLTLVADRHPSAGESPPVVLLHGGGQTRHSWGRVARLLARSGYESWTVDLRGHGDSDWSSDGDYSMEAMADDLADICEQVGEAPVVVGASMGGLVALSCEGLHY